MISLNLSQQQRISIERKQLGSLWKHQLELQAASLSKSGAEASGARGSEVSEKISKNVHVEKKSLSYNKDDGGKICF